MEIKDTLNLPETDFPMKASLIKAEPQMLEWWAKEKIYEEIRESSKGKEKFVFHDGPPYANGHIHMGHALNTMQVLYLVGTVTGCPLSIKWVRSSKKKR